MTSRELIRWSSTHERRARQGRPSSSPLVIAIVAGATLATWVAWRDAVSADAASHVWLAGTIGAFALAFMRVPFHIYWRADAALLAQLPIAGTPLFVAALVRCIRAASATTLATLIGAAPLVRDSPELAARHAVVAVTLGVAAALFMPAVAIWAASLVALGKSSAMHAVRIATGIVSANPLAAIRPAGPPEASGALLGALPGFASTLVIVGILLVSPWLTGDAPVIPVAVVVGALAATSVLAIVATRAGAPAIMGTILRDVSALDRQRLAALEIKPPTAIEAAIARRLGDAALPYAKDARLMRRRYPLVYALGALAFLVLAIIGLARPTDPLPWLVTTLVLATWYGIALAGRLDRPPIELGRLAATLPITAGARRRAKLAAVAAWWTIYILVPAVFAAVRQREPAVPLVLIAAATFVLGTVSRLTRLGG